MEDMARLALIEHSVNSEEEFIRILEDLSTIVKHVLSNPQYYKTCKIESNILKEAMKYDAFIDYLKYLGFEPVNNDFIYPKEVVLSNLKMAQIALKRKKKFCVASLTEYLSFNQTPPTFKKYSFKPVNVLNTENVFLKKIEALFDTVLSYEDEELQVEMREHIPIVSLQLLALDRMRDHQKKIKTGELKGEDDMPFDLAFLLVVMEWFKNEFFSWVNSPDCKSCGGPTEYHHQEQATFNREICNVEVFSCLHCGDAGGARFPRFNDPRMLLKTRRGRCGEWANCFTLVCRALGYDTRYVFDVSDHVWCEVFDYDSNRWLHVDPCECKLDAPLLYEYGWGKKLSYVIAVSRDDLQDVTWRYTTNHKEVLKRRDLVTERELIASIMALREHRQLRVSRARLRYLTKRTLRELVELMVEKKPGENETEGRLSGSRAWRAARGELGGRVFELNGDGCHRILYQPSPDKYVVEHDGEEVEQLSSWSTGAHRTQNVFRKVENDWRMVYLAREEGQSLGLISWKVAVTREDRIFDYVELYAATQTYNDAVIKWSVQFDCEEPVAVEFGDTKATFHRRFRSMELTAELTGGTGALAWQHAQLFRSPLKGQDFSPFEIMVRVAKAL